MDKISLRVSNFHSLMLDLTIWIKVVLSLICILVIGCVGDEERMRGSRLYISGDSHSIGAEIHIDDQKVGIMEKRVYSGPSPTEEEIKKQHEMQRRLGIPQTDPPKPGDIFAIGVDIHVNSGEKQPEYGIYGDIRVPSGKHKILFVNKEGKRLEKQIEIKGENYIAVDFDKMIIQGR